MNDKNEYAYELGERLYNTRKNIGLTQSEVAEKLDVSFQAVSSWERGEYIPDTYNLISLAHLYEVSLSSLVEEKLKINNKAQQALYDWEHMKTYVLTCAKCLKFTDTQKALTFALKAHEGTKRKKSDIPYIYHPLNMACHLLSMGINDDQIIAATLLHDVVEDCSYTIDELPVNDETKLLVQLMTHPKQYNDREEIMKDYYKGLASNPKAALIKLTDRCNNLTTMAWGLSREKQYRYINETEQYILPLLKTLKHTEYDNAQYLLSYQIRSMIDIYKRLL